MVCIGFQRCTHSVLRCASTTRRLTGETYAKATQLLQRPRVNSGLRSRVVIGARKWQTVAENGQNQRHVSVFGCEREKDTPDTVMNGFHRVALGVVRLFSCLNVVTLWRLFFPSMTQEDVHGSSGFHVGVRSFTRLFSTCVVLTSCVKAVKILRASRFQVLVV